MVKTIRSCYTIRCSRKLDSIVNLSQSKISTLCDICTPFFVRKIVKKFCDNDITAQIIVSLPKNGETVQNVLTILVTENGVHVVQRVLI